MLIYVADDLQASFVDISVALEEYLFIKVKSSSCPNKMLIGNIYRSPTNSSIVHNKMMTIDKLQIIYSIVYGTNY